MALEVLLTIPIVFLKPADGSQSYSDLRSLCLCPSVFEDFSSGKMQY